MSKPRRIVCPLLTALVVFLDSPARADSWLPPKTKVEFSKNGFYRLTMTPWFVLKERGGKDSSGKLVDSRALGKLEKKDADNTFRTVWEQPLTNEQSPVRLLVSNEGVVVTLDNWHSVGYGSNVVVIYAPDGKLVRSMGLDDFLSAEEIRGLDHSISSIWWGTDHQFDRPQYALILFIGNDSLPAGSGDGSPRKIAMVNLKTGKVITFSRDQPKIGKVKPPGSE